MPVVAKSPNLRTRLRSHEVSAGSQTADLTQLKQLQNLEQDTHSVTQSPLIRVISSMPVDGVYTFSLGVVKSHSCSCHSTVSTHCQHMSLSLSHPVSCTLRSNPARRLLCSAHTKMRWTVATVSHPATMCIKAKEQVSRVCSSWIVTQGRASSVPQLRL